MRPVLSPAELERYGRQILIDEIGPTGQEKLKVRKNPQCGDCGGPHGRKHP